MGKKAANRVVENNGSNKVFDLWAYYNITPSEIVCDTNQEHITGILTYNYMVTTEEGIVEKTASKEVELDCSNVQKKENRFLDVYVTLSDGDDEVVSAMSVEYTCIPSNIEVTYCIDKLQTNVYYLAQDKKRWIENSEVPKEGGSVLVIFKYIQYVKNDSGEESNEGYHYELIKIPPCHCGENSDCSRILVGEIEFKRPHIDGCNITTYAVKQETCSNIEK